MNKFLVNLCCAFIAKKKNRHHFRSRYKNLSVFESIFFSKHTLNKLSNLDSFGDKLERQMKNINDTLLNLQFGCQVVTNGLVISQEILSKFKAVLQKTFPDLILEKIDIRSSEKVVFIVNDSYIFCCFGNLSGVEDYCKRQMYFIERVKPFLKLEMPDTKILSKEFFYYRSIEGKCDVPLNDELISQLVNIINELHNVEYSEDDSEGILRTDRIVNRVTGIDQKIDIADFLKGRYHLILKCLDENEKDDFVSGYNEFLKEHGKHLRFVHGDLWNCNMIVDDTLSNVKSIIDFGTACLSNYNNEFLIMNIHFLRKEGLIWNEVQKRYEKLSGRKIN
jgi:hypothetical protein